MATLRKYRDGGFYILRGYPISHNGVEEDMFFTTIQVFPRAERFFEVAGYTDGTLIPREVFYALLLDGDLTSPSIESRQFSVRDIPRNVIYSVAGQADSDFIRSLMREPKLAGVKYLCDFFDIVHTRKPGKAAPTTAAILCLAKHAKQTAYDRQRGRLS